MFLSITIISAFFTCDCPIRAIAYTYFDSVFPQNSDIAIFALGMGIKHEHAIDLSNILTELKTDGNLVELRNLRKNDVLPDESHSKFPAAAKPADGDINAFAALSAEGAVVLVN